MNGWMGKIIRVNLTNETITTEPLNLQDAKLYVGGRGLGTKIYMDEVDPQIDPLSPENKMIFMTGPLTGTLAACAGRYEVVAKAPLTGTIGACSSGGHFGPELKFAGYDGIIFEGKAKNPVYLYINDDHIELKDASHLWGKEVPATTEEVAKETDEDAKIACIGPAGEKLVLFAVIMNDKNRAAVRSGLGAVMGSKNLKAVAVKGTKSIQVAKQKEFLDSCLKSREIMKDNPVTGAGLPSYGTQILVNTLNQSEVHPTRNWQHSFYDSTDDISGETLTQKHLVRNRGCFDCSIGCGRVTKIERSQFINFGEGADYEAGWPSGSDCENNNLRSAWEANFLCNEIGMDPITMGLTIACAMKLYEKGYITNKNIGMDISFSNADAVAKLTKMTGYREGFGDRLALGSYRMAADFGHPELSISVKKQEMPAYDGRAIQEIGLEYTTSNRGECHVRSYMTSPEILGIPEKMDPLVTEGRAAALKTFQDLTAVVDSVGMCLFTTLAIGLPEIAEMLRTCTGLDYTDEEVLRIGERIWNIERIFNIKNGFSKKDDTLPPKLLSEPVGEGPAKGKVNQLNIMLPEYYAVRGWDKEGVPTEVKKKELSIV